MNEHWKAVAAVSMVVILLGTAPFAVASAETRAGTSVSVGPEVTGDPDETATLEPGETVTLTVWANATNVSGYQSRLTFDQTVVEVTAVSGTADFDSPVASVDNENGSVAFNQIRSDEATDPLLAEITLEVVGTDGQQSDLSFDASETKISNDTGETFQPDSSRSLTIDVESASSPENETESGPTGNETESEPTEGESESEPETDPTTPPSDSSPNAGGSGDSGGDANRNAGGSGGGSTSEPPSFHVSSVAVNKTSAAVGETVAVRADVRNNGGDGTYTALFRVNGTEIGTSEIDIDAGENRTVEVTHRLSGPGTYEFSLNDRIVGKTKVTDATSTSTDPDPAADRENLTVTDRTTPVQTTTESAPAATESTSTTADEPSESTADESPEPTTDGSPEPTTVTSETLSQFGSDFGALALIVPLAMLVSGLLVYVRRN